MTLKRDGGPTCRSVSRWANIMPRPRDSLKVLVVAHQLSESDAGRRWAACGGTRRRVYTASGAMPKPRSGAGMPDTRCEPAVSGIDATVSGTEATVGGVEATVGGMPAPRHAGLGMPPAS